MAALKVIDAAAQDAAGLVRVADFTNHVGMTVHGQYLLRAIRNVTDGNPHLQLNLADASGNVAAFVWTENRPAVTPPAVGLPVAVTADVRTYNDAPQLKVMQLAPLAADDVACVADLLPGVAAGSLASLREAEAVLPQVLHRFVSRVLLDPAIGPDFVACRASEHHHHAWRGGLFAHSVENLDLIRMAVQRFMPVDDKAPGVAVTGYLLHDVGKIRTVGRDTRPPLPFAVSHEMYNLLVLAPHLAWLRQADPVAHAALAFVFQYLMTPARTRECDAYLPARIVAGFDHFSAAAFDAASTSEFAKQGPRSQPHRGQSARWHSARADMEHAA